MEFDCTNDVRYRRLPAEILFETLKSFAIRHPNLYHEGGEHS